MRSAAIISRVAVAAISDQDRMQPQRRFGWSILKSGLKMRSIFKPVLDDQPFSRTLTDLLRV